MHKETAEIHTRIRRRIELLKEIGEEEEIAYNANSEHDLWRFLKRLSFIKSPALFLLDNGNLRTVWKGDGGKHIGLQFLGGGQIQFVIFSRQGEHNNMARIRGRDDFSGIARQLDADEENGHEADPSHALICGAPDPTTDSELAETVGDMIAACVTELHPATTEQVATN